MRNANFPSHEEGASTHLGRVGKRRHIDDFLLVSEDSSPQEPRAILRIDYVSSFKGRHSSQESTCRGGGGKWYGICKGRGPLSIVALRTREVSVEFLSRVLDPFHLSTLSAELEFSDMNAHLHTGHGRLKKAPIFMGVFSNTRRYRTLSDLDKPPRALTQLCTREMSCCVA